MAGRTGRPRKEGARYPSGALKAATIKEQARKNVEAAARRGLSSHLSAGEGRAAIYIMRGEGRVKIGVSKTPAFRCVKVQGQHGFGLAIAWLAWGVEDDVRKLERAVHKLMKKSLFAEGGEFYAVTVQSAIDFVLGFASMRGIALDVGAENDRRSVPRLKSVDTALGSNIVALTRCWDGIKCSREN